MYKKPSLFKLDQTKINSLTRWAEQASSESHLESESLGLKGDTTASLCQGSTVDPLGQQTGSRKNVKGQQQGLGADHQCGTQCEPGPRCQSLGIPTAYRVHRADMSETAKPCFLNRFTPERVWKGEQTEFDPRVLTQKARNGGKC